MLPDSAVKYGVLDSEDSEESGKRQTKPTRTTSDLFGMFDKLVGEFSGLSKKLDELISFYKPKIGEQQGEQTGAPGANPQK